MNYRRGFFRVWAVMAALWLTITGVLAFGFLRSAYHDVVTRETFAFTDAAGRNITVISPSHYSASEYIRGMLEPGAQLQAPDCNDAQSHCNPSDRDWSGLKLLPGSSLGPDRVIVGPFSIEDGPGFEAANSALRSEIVFWGIVCFGVPLVIGALMVAIGWAAQGFRTA